MSNASEKIVPHQHRPLTLCSRRDLIYQRQTHLGKAWWIIKDPLSLKYFRFPEEACAALQMLDGNVSLHELKTALESRFPTRKMQYSEIQSLLGMLHQSGLVVADASGQGAQLYKRRVEQRRKKILGQLSSILWIRLPGVDPERFLVWLHPKVRWFFSTSGVLACILFALAALSLVTVHCGEFYDKLPSLHQFFSAANLGWLMLALAFVKILHELGHGLACKHFGGECHEIGIMLLVMTPCLYCDTSDSWILPNKWHRAAIGAAGMYVEIIVASICTFVWWFTDPGLLHYLCLNIIFICSVSTIIFNSNPLLRYDGYYILSDVLEIPNLAQKSRTALIGLLRKWCLGLPWNQDQMLPNRKRLLFAFYAVASVCYRWFILFAILWFLSEVFEPYGLQAIGHTLIASSLIGIVVVPAWRVIRFFRIPGRMKQVNKHRLLVTTAFVIALLFVVAFMPLPHCVLTAVMIQPRDAQRVYVNVPGFVRTVSVEEGTPVLLRKELAVLENSDVSLQMVRLTGEHRRLKQQLQNLRRQQGLNDDAAQQIPHTVEALESVENQLKQLRIDEQQLTLRSPTSGIVISPSYISAEQTTNGSLSTSRRTPLDEENRNAWLDTGTLFCIVGDLEKMEAVLVVDQTEIEFIRRDQLVEINLDEYPGEIWTGRIHEIATIDLQVAPRALSQKAGGGLSTETDEAGAERPSSVTYQARVELANSDERLLPGFRGRAKVHVGSRTFGAAVLRYLAETIRFS